jgi:hypothetical protein
VISAILKILAAVFGWAFAWWKEKHDPSVAQRSDQIERDYARKREDLGRR